jgi:integrase
MATFKAVVRTPRKDGFYQVYVRVTHNTKVGYIKMAGKVVTKNELDRKGDIIDPYVLRFCSDKILMYSDKLLRVDIEPWSIAQVMKFLEQGEEDVSFSGYARKFIDEMVDRGQERNARNYRAALASLELFAGTSKVKFSHLTSMFVNRWIKSLMKTARAKEMYPVCMRQVFKKACDDYNDYDNGVLVIKTNPWAKAKIPVADTPEKRAITPEECRVFFSAPLPETKFKAPLTEFGRDVAKLSLCLAGMNTMDMYNLRKRDYYNGIIHYHRCKTRKSRSDDAYFEIRVPPILQPLMEKYADTDPKSEWLFNFHDRMSTADSFNGNSNAGIKQVCRALGIPQENWYSVYTFRHTFATVAQNDCGASMSDVSFAMNHSQKGSAVTRGYVIPDFSPVWELNEKVIEFIFFSDEASSRVRAKEPSIFRLSPKCLVKADAFFGGRIVASVKDIGFATIDAVISALASELPDEIPERATVQFRIKNLDKGDTAVYERTKGKGF